MTTPFESPGIGPSLRTAPDVVSRYSEPPWLQYAPSGPALTIQPWMGLIVVLATTAPLCETISSHWVAPAVSTLTTSGLGTGAGTGFAVGTGGGTRYTCGEASPIVALALTSDTVVVRVVTAATPHPESTTRAAGMASAAKFRVIDLCLRHPIKLTVERGTARRVSRNETRGRALRAAQTLLIVSVCTPATSAVSTV